MSAPEESLNGQDPDYVSTTSNDQAQQKIYEENARNTTAKKITAIVEKEFSREIDLKEKEILQIQERLHKTLKIFHLLRYVIITNFYNRKQCQRPQAAETTKQTRIHPAIKTLLGKCPKSTDCTDLAVPSTSTDPRFLYNECLASGASTTANSTLKIEENANKRDGALQGEKRKASDEEPQPRKIPRYVPPKSSVPEKACPSRGNSHKVRKRIVVGNISKWIPPDWREDASSHKWTMYVRGDKDENANIGTFVSKVRFFLHPSYRPNDVVEVTSYPFHLSRRGWGEFPLRVQLHFKNALNKPMDIIHHLKLDRTYTGLQTLGSETLVDVWIHTAESRNPEQNNHQVESSINNDTLVKVEPNGNGNSFEFTHKQSANVAEMSRLTVNTSEKMQLKEMSEACKRLTSSLDLTGIKTEPNDADATTRVSNDKHGEAIRNPIEHDHNYYSRQYFNSGPCTVREGNVTVEHCPENDCTTFAITSVESNEKNADLVVPSHRFNGDIQSSGNYQPLSSNSNATTDASLVVNTFQKNNSQKSLSSPDTVKSLRAKNSNSDNTFGISETISAKDTVTTTNGFHKPSRASLACFNNLQKAASSSEINTSHLRPLHISIPPSNIFASSTSKHVLLLKDKKSIPVDLASILPSKSNENSKKFVDGDVKVSVPRDGSVARLNVRVPQGVSILKKPPNAKANARKEGTVDNNKKAVVLKLKSANSLLLNVNENVPILKIADSRDLRNTYGLAEATTRSNPLIGKQQESVSCARSEKTVVQRAKVTLGKDKFKIQSKKDLYEAVLRSIDTVNIADTEALIRFIIRRVPIVTRDARDPEYRRLHPYACCSEEEYFAYNVGKRRAMEWYRAKTIRSFLRMKPIPIDQLWTIKEIILWARLHGYTPSRNAFGVQETAGTSDTKKLPDTTTSATVLSTCTEPRALHKWLQTCQQEPNRQSKDNHIDDEEIDVENVKESPRSITIDRRKNDSDKNSTCSTGSTLLPIELDEDLLPFHNFVCDTARDIGIKITPEEIIPGVVYCAASRVMMRVVECFVEDLTRSSLARAWERNSGNECPKVITPNDVRNALANREEFDIFTNEGLGSRQELNTTEL
ncbi:YEATS domain-containing protein 2 [Temnothorax curvispinosus]|uniref:YEATS domain-containing protein 2 n=1 Tax=Temnothorax curvispinosus TaxID=300111 RepID=A0A6J1PX84_9HYME|nr:YEATS domain-containing protein 2 [Temnothorax curvispinosus]XP_024873968.1 YEATS domain-containing protein 2 [Temnothorax curvispinosus]